MAGKHVLKTFALTEENDGGVFAPDADPVEQGVEPVEEAHGANASPLTGEGQRS